MKLEKAIEIKQASQRRHHHIMSPLEVIADNISIEALKGIKAVRQLYPELSPFPLPGET